MPFLTLQPGKSCRVQLKSSAEDALMVAYWEFSSKHRSKRVKNGSQCSVTFPAVPPGDTLNIHLRVGGEWKVYVHQEGAVIGREAGTGEKILNVLSN